LCKDVPPRYHSERDDQRTALHKLSISTTVCIGEWRVSKLLYPLSDEDVRQIALLVETLDQTSLDFLQLELGDTKLTIGKGEMPVVATSAVAAPSAPPAPSAPLPETPETPATALAAAPETAPAVPPAAPAADDGTEVIVAPIMGRFYAKPDPASPPFVTVGSEVSEDTTVALIEVMKVFNAVRAGVRGVITEICVQDTAIIEYGQVMFRVRPAE
jgi:acetyl-CoA carboxylase biotin carboxyl carrier protein